MSKLRRDNVLRCANDEKHLPLINNASQYTNTTSYHLLPRDTRSLSSHIRSSDVYQKPDTAGYWLPVLSSLGTVRNIQINQAITCHTQTLTDMNDVLNSNPWQELIISFIATLLPITKQTIRGKQMPRRQSTPQFRTAIGAVSSAVTRSHWVPLFIFL